MTREFMYENGQKVREKVTGFTGTITGICFYITGCNSYCITPTSEKPSVKAEGVWYDEERLELLSDDKLEIKTVKNGCGMCPPIGTRG